MLALVASWDLTYGENVGEHGAISGSDAAVRAILTNSKMTNE